MREIILKSLLSKIGVPSTIVSNKDLRFILRFWGALQKAFGTKLCLSIAYHPQIDGQTNRSIQTLQDMLRAYVLDKLCKWERNLPLVEFVTTTVIILASGWHLIKPFIAESVNLLYVGISRQSKTY